MNSELNKDPAHKNPAGNNIWDNLWINVNLVTMQDGHYNEILGGAIATTDSRISWLGLQQQLSAPPARLSKNVIDANGCWMTPGLIDCHTHLVFGANRAREFEQRLQGVNYAEIAAQGGGIISTVTETRAASTEALVQSGRPRLESLIKSGVTTVEVKSGYGLDVDTELRMLKAMTELEQSLPVSIQKTYLGGHSIPPEYTDHRNDYIQLICKEMLPRIADGHLASAVDMFCETIGISIAEAEQILRTATDLNLDVKLHADQLSDMGASTLAAEFGALSADHLEYCPASGVAAMAASGTVAVLLPGAFYYLRETSSPPINLFRSQGVPIAVATDFNPGSSPIASLPIVMNMACTLFGLTPEEALAGVTLNAAKALGLSQDRGSLEIGKRADLALWDILSPADISYWVGLDRCVSTVKNGTTNRAAISQM